MSTTWLESQRNEILNRQIAPDILTKSLVTDKILKRRNYACKDKYVTLQAIPIWKKQQSQTNNEEKQQKKQADDDDDILSLFSILKCDISTLEIDCIVNAANEGLLGGGGVDEAIHKAAGPLLQFECANLPLCYPGNAVITKGYLLPSPFVIHTVGPYLDTNNQTQPQVLKQCYRSVLDLCVEYGIKSVAIPPISTGFYGFPKQEAAQIAVAETVKYISSNRDKCKGLRRIIFVDISKEGVDCYHNALLKIG